MFIQFEKLAHLVLTLFSFEWSVALPGQAPCLQAHILRVDVPLFFIYSGGSLV